MSKPLPVYLILILLLMLAAGGAIGGAHLLAEGQLLHAMPSLIVGVLAAMSSLGLIRGRPWARRCAMYGCFLAGVAGLAGMAYIATRTGPGALRGMPQIVLMTVGCILAASWLRYSFAARRYFLGEHAP